MKEFKIGKRSIGPKHPPLVIAEIGINHEGSFDKAIRMINDAAQVGCECVKFQTHIIQDEMIPNDVIPANAKESIWNIIKRCALSEEDEVALKKHAESKGLIFLSTPFSRQAADRLEKLKVPAYKIGSGECNNYPLVEHIAKMGKPIILSTGMNDLDSIKKSLAVIDKYSCPVILMHCTSMYPTPYGKVRLGAIKELEQAFDLPVGLSDHSVGIYTCLGAVALGAVALEKHFTVSRNWPGPDIAISIEPQELAELVAGSRAIWQARGGSKTILPEERPVIDFAYACVVSTRAIKAGEVLNPDNIWVKRPGTGEIKASSFSSVLGKRAKVNINKDVQLTQEHIDG